MQGDYNVSRQAFAWLLLSQAFLLLPQLLRFPSLLLPLWVVATVWRFMIFQSRWSYPASWMKIVLVVAAVVLIRLQGFRVYSTEFMVCLLLSAYLLKLLEMKTLRDVLIFVYLSYFVIVTQLLFSQSMLSGLYLLIAIILVTTSLIASHRNHEEPFFQPLKSAGNMIAISLPLMLVAFMVFPRLEPFWSVPMPGGKGTTGISDTMEPGMVSDLAKSDALAFRAFFNNGVPATQQLYWRGIVMSDFDGRRWSMAAEKPMPSANMDDLLLNDQVITGSKIQDYQVTMEASFKPWLFVLDQTVASKPSAVFFRDGSLQAQTPIFQRKSYNFSFIADAKRDVDIYRYHRARNLHLVDGLHPQTLAFARQLWQQLKQSKSDTLPWAYVNAILDFYRQQEFSYTLSPLALSGDSIDSFLFETRQGFCEHYASSFVILMRAVGIPARVVTGYQGGDANPFEQHVTVRQLDAHAWAEIWLAGKGWVRVDPTAAVAPERIELGSSRSLRNDSEFLSESPLSSKHFQSLQWLTTMSYRYDQLNALWHRSIIGYEGSVQNNVLKALLGEVSVRRIALFILSVFVSIALLITLVYWWRFRPKPQSDLQKAWNKWCSKTAKAGLISGLSEGPLDYRQRCLQRWPEHSADIEAIFSTYITLTYAVDSEPVLIADMCDASDFSPHQQALISTMAARIKRISLP